MPHPNSFRLLHRPRPHHPRHMHPRPVEPLEQCGELRRRQAHHSINDRRPFEAALFEPLIRIPVILEMQVYISWQSRTGCAAV